MSALARYFASTGKSVSGYDRTETDLTRQLQSERISIHFTDDPNLADKNAQLVVYTPAIPKDHRELNYFLSNGYPVHKRSEVLGMITSDTFSICVAGTHGKTTTSSMIAHILRDSGFGCNAFLGGIASNYNTNFWSNDKNVSVAEADEYDRSFLQLNPDIAVITSMDPDHLDIYGTPEKLKEAFVEFGNRVKPGGYLIYKKGLTRTEEIKVSNMLSYSLHDNGADITATNIRAEKGSYVFDVMLPAEVVKDVVLNMGGRHNIENVTAAIAVAKRVGISEEGIRSAVSSFKGVKRRFEYVLKDDNLVLIDDYAHHPEELRALITGAKELFAGKRCTVVFQPHLFSRTNDFADGFAEVLSLADDVWLLPIYPAREEPMPGVTSGMIKNRISKTSAQLISKEELLGHVNELSEGLLIMCGAGDIDVLVEPVKNILQNNIRKLNANK